MNEQLLHKFLNNELSESQLQELKASEEYSDYLKIAEATANLQTPEYNTNAAWRSLAEKRKAKEAKVISMFNYRNLLKYAAVFAVIFAGYFYLNTMETTVSTSLAEKATIILPDNSEVTLNASSSITYKKLNWAKNRKVKLDGEAYFIVANGKTFDVETTQGIVSVLGTQFNVHSRNGYFDVTCYEGLVSVLLNGTEIALPAGNAIAVENGVVMAKNTVNYDSPGWINMESRFENVTLKRVIKELERQYNTEITANNIDLNQRFTGVFPHNNLNFALKAVCIPLILNFTIDDKGKVLIYEE